ncbi:uncharacterized protein LOC115168709 isoform X1 [Salmo trutta]|uniref:uncharacterized protein LOC115168709 isoform X1 n=1 Tax=Salmo trutta TaxID=8032 RepID=UPI00113007A2|nr:uncharacterized protein LOC115168709 isoform X1 [Salmo trutta]
MDCFLSGGLRHMPGQTQHISTGVYGTERTHLPAEHPRHQALVPVFLHGAVLQRGYGRGRRREQHPPHPLRHPHYSGLLVVRRRPCSVSWSSRVRSGWRAAMMWTVPTTTQCWPCTSCLLNAGGTHLPTQAPRHCTRTQDSQINSPVQGTALLSSSGALWNSYMTCSGKCPPATQREAGPSRWRST